MYHCRNRLIDDERGNNAPKTDTQHTKFLSTDPSNLNLLDSMGSFFVRDRYIILTILHNGIKEGKYGGITRKEWNRP